MALSRLSPNPSYPALRDMCHREALVTHASGQTNQQVSGVGVRNHTVQAILEAERVSKAQSEILVDD
ncbi:unnamed protein product [Fusarium graminearum]|uniref:Uncharacterized protein n=1 Tax=Gibberella zeae TaxID=5518 RepID=A0A4U9EPR4_GIBZA|nr:unnamed protein product [Fusarium graminearum]CAF3477144.1 unnamed protein product [Fusarium graminearum]CAG1959828.1 unnamed protein product [Fusarium graminearum]CAG1974754.1 unnamed protein product [Fusarium graminearum]CAG1982320.1 unnamed protein product [Fusarium graminearum]